MRIIFVRHGHPDYKNDCLTPLGHRHAQAAALRLADEGISRICSSSRGRALQTAEHLARLLKLDVEPCGFMREIGWGSLNDEPIFEDGHPWYTADDMAARGQSVLNPHWALQEPFCRNRVIHSVAAVEEGFDQWLAALGFEREGLYYRVGRPNPDTIAMVSHGGSSSAALAHLFNLPFPFVCAAVKPDFTAITVITLEGAQGSLISPAVELMNDARHIADIPADALYIPG